MTVQLFEPFSLRGITLHIPRGQTLGVIRDPKDDYTRTLLDAIPNPF